MTRTLSIKQSSEKCTLGKTIRIYEILFSDISWDCRIDNMANRRTIDTNDEEIINKCIGYSDFSNPWNWYCLDIVYLFSFIVFDKWLGEHIYNSTLGTRCLLGCYIKHLTLECINQFLSFCFARNLNWDIGIHFIYIPSFEYVRIQTTERPCKFPTKIIKYIFSIQYLLTETFKTSSYLLVSFYFSLEFLWIKSYYKRKKSHTNMRIRDKRKRIFGGSFKHFLYFLKFPICRRWNWCHKKINLHTITISIDHDAHRIEWCSPYFSIFENIIFVVFDLGFWYFWEIITSLGKSLDRLQCSNIPVCYESIAYTIFTEYFPCKGRESCSDEFIKSCW